MDKQNIQGRLQKEAEFHDHSFSSDLRSPTTKYYTIVGDCRADYKNKIAKNISGKKVLEYGCGTGSYGFELAKNGAEVFGIDISPVAIELATKTAAEQGVSGNTTFKVMNAEELLFEDNSFDLICGTGIIHHLELEKSFSEIKRVLKNSGEAVFCEPLGHNPFINWYRNRTPEMRTEDEHPLLMTDFELAEKYFSKVDIKYFSLMTLSAVPFRNSPVFKPFLGFTEFLDRIVLNKFSPLKRWAWNCNITLEK